MIKNKFKILSVRTIGEKNKNPDMHLGKFEKHIKTELPEHYRSMLLEYAGPIIFDEPNILKPVESSPIDRKDGTQSIGILYGLGDGDNSLMTMFERYEGRIPKQTITIGEIVGGNQICMCLSGDKVEKIYLWHHEDEREITGKPENDFGNMYLISDSFESLINSIEKGQEDGDNNDLGIVESESWLDI